MTFYETLCEVVLLSAPGENLVRWLQLLGQLSSQKSIHCFSLTWVNKFPEGFVNFFPPPLLPDSCREVLFRLWAGYPVSHYMGFADLLAEGQIDKLREISLK